MPSDDPSQARNALQHPEGRPLQQRVDNKTNDQTGNLEDQKLDVDARTLALLGKRQRLNRNFGLVSMVAFATTLQQAWVSVASTFQYGIVSGGPVNVLWGLVFCWVGSMAIAGSLAEMTSMAPTAGAQYHWTALLAPVRFATGFSWCSGWITVFARTSLFASTSFVAAEWIEGVAALNYPNYSPTQWQTTMIYWGIILVTTAVNILGIRKFPHIETIAFVFFVSMFFVVIVPLVYLTPQSTSEFVFTDFENSTGWSSNGLVWFLGLLNAAYTFVGIDGTSHMSEEVRNSNTVVPKSMLWSQIINGVLGVSMSIILLYGIGDIKQALGTSTNFAFIEILYNATQSKAATSLLVALIIIMVTFSSLGILASASRLTWAFARDNGLPFPTYFKHVNRQYGIPVRSLLLVVVAAALLGLINIGSQTAFQAIISLALIGHYISYFLPIFLLTIRRFTKKEIPFGPWSLGRWGLFVNLGALGYITIIVIFMVFPSYQPVTASEMNYSGPIFGIAMILCAVFWFTYGRKTYTGPVQEVIDDKNIQA